VRVTSAQLKRPTYTSANYDAREPGADEMTLFS
jgi:hypothetical protein